MKQKLNYGEYAIEFDFPGSLATDPQLMEKIKDTHFWFEVVLFELLDEDCDGRPDEKFGKEFSIHLGDPVAKGKIEEDDYSKMKTSGKLVSRGSFMVSGFLFPEVICRRKQI